MTGKPGLQLAEHGFYSCQAVSRTATSDRHLCQPAPDIAALRGRISATCDRASQFPRTE